MEQERKILDENIANEFLEENKKRALFMALTTLSIGAIALFDKLFGNTLITLVLMLLPAWILKHGYSIGRDIIYSEQGKQKYILDDKIINNIIQSKDKIISKQYTTSYILISVIILNVIYHILDTNKHKGVILILGIAIIVILADFIYQLFEKQGYIRLLTYDKKIEGNPLVMISKSDTEESFILLIIFLGSWFLSNSFLLGLFIFIISLTLIHVSALDINYNYYDDETEELFDIED